MKFHRFASVLFILTLNASAGLVFHDLFHYLDGPLTRGENSPWVSHGGTLDQVNVVSGIVHLTQQESEDVNAPLEGGPYNRGILYASCLVNFSDLPSGEGGFFLHFKDGGSMQKARVYATTNGAARGSFRLGIANGSALPRYIASDLHPTTSYRIVIRYRADAPTSSTLWINPKSEGDMNLWVEATDLDRSASISAIALRQSLVTGDGMGGLLLGDLLVGTEFGDVAGANTPPTISPVADQDVGADETVGPLDFSVGDRETPAGQLDVHVDSTNLALLSTKSVSFGGEGSDRTILLRPAPGQQGVTKVTLTVTDGVKSSSTSFTLAVGVPTLGGPEEAETAMNASAPDLNFEIQDRESAPEQLVLTATSSNPALLSASGIQWLGSSARRTLRLTPIPDQTGSATLTVKLTDGVHVVIHQLVLTVFPNLGTALAENFNIPDGTLIRSDTPWRIHAPENGQATNILVKRGRLQLSSARLEDFHADFRGGPFKPESGAILYSGFRIRCVELPSSGGTYFAHLRDDRTTFHARVYAAKVANLANHYRLGISSGSGAPVYLPGEFELGEELIVVVKYNVATAQSFLWLNPRSESDPGLESTDHPSPISISNWSFRQADGIGLFEIDDLKIASSFIQALPDPFVFRLEAKKVADSIVLSWRSMDGIILQHRELLSSGEWKSVELSRTEEGGVTQVRLKTRGPTDYFRLRLP